MVACIEPMTSHLHVTQSPTQKKPGPLLNLQTAAQNDPVSVILGLEAHQIVSCLHVSNWRV